MKVAFVSEHASPLAVLGGVDAGGQNVHVAALAEAMARHGADVRVYTRRDDARLPAVVPFCTGVLVDHIDAGPAHAIEKDRLLPYMKAFAAQLAERFGEWRPDVVHAHFWMSGKASLDAALPRQIPVVQTFHALGIEKRRYQGVKDTSPQGRLDEENRIAREATHIVATASAEGFELVGMGADRSKITVVPCGVDLAHFSALGPSERRNRGMRRLLCVSRLVERKGIGDIIAALPMLEGTELIIAGGPDEADLWNDSEACRLRDIARSLGVSDRVTFRGRVDRLSMPALMRSADAVVCYPWYEPFGLVPLEAMACGIPVVVAAVGGLVDSVLNGITGVHVEPRSSVALAQAIAPLLRDEHKRIALGRAGERRANERFGWPRIASDTLSVYEGVIARPGYAAQAS
ncbi:MAG: glycosyltransferase [Candidatus Eremiobacteraeota bacterium]|nr:glycosyltransferase [Candidatus Eremiobacteraeota bacterium]